MKFSDFLTYVTHNAELIIQWLFFTIIALSALVVGRYIFARKEEDTGAGSTAPLPGEIQSVLQKILDQTNKLENVSVEALKGGSQEALVQLEILKKDLQSREEEISRLRKVDLTDEKAAEFTTRIKELEARLEEYSILEDDIADLSLYKEENIRLKAEIEQLRSAGASEDSLDSGELSEDDVLDPNLESLASEALAEGEAEGSQMTIVERDGNPMSEFESALDEEKNQTDPSANLFGEFAQPEEGAELGDHDAEKMIQELAEMVTSVEASEGSSLEADVDTSKVIDEANKISKLS